MKAALVAASLLLAPCAAYALDPRRAVTQYRRDAWGTKDGLPQSSVEAIAQTRDGYLWLGTQEGLVRFDGVRFTVFNKATGSLAHNRVLALHEDRAGALWIGTEGGGVSRYREGIFTTWREAEGMPLERVRAIAEDGAGELWLATDVGLVRKRGEGFAAAGLEGTVVLELRTARDGSLWAGTRDGALVPVRHGRPGEPLPLPGAGGVRALWEDDNGTLWVGRGAALVRVESGRATVFTARDGLPGRAVQDILRDRAGNLWIGVEAGGLARLRGRSFEVLTAPDGLSNNLVLRMLEDREGSLWVGMQDGGLNRLADGKLVTWSTREGLAEDVVWPVLASREGDLWIGTSHGGLSRLRDGRFTRYTAGSGLSSNSVQALAEDAEGAIWVGTRGGGLDRLHRGRWSRLTTRDGLPGDSVSALLPARDGTLWIGTRGNGLARLRSGVVAPVGGEAGLAHETIHFLLEGRKGEVWIATDGKGLARYADGAFTFYTTKDGLSANIVNTMLEDGDGTLWIGTYGGGLTRLREGHFTRYTTQQGLHDDAIFGLLDDGAGHFWMSCNRGISRVSRREIEDLDAGRLPALRPVVYGREDGMRNAECNGANQPPATRGADGRLWFPTIEGVVTVDPRQLPENEAPPPVVIEELLVDGKALPVRGPVTLPAGAGRVEVRYTANSLRVPGRVRFRYRLSGFDPDWVDVGARRAAYYTNLAPGSYRFQVMAANDDGRWNEEGAGLDLRLAPLLYQARWFQVLALAALAAAGFGAYRLRIQQLLARERRLEELVATRTQELEGARQRLAALAHLRERDETVRLLQEGTVAGGPTEQPTVSELAPTPSAARSVHPLAAQMLEDSTRLVAGRYELREMIGEGGMGVVYRAHDRELDEPVALKLVRRVAVGGDSLGERLRQELRLTRRVTHANVVRTHDIGEAGGASYISMEYVRGITLKELVKRKGRLPVAVGLGLAKQICHALEAAHRHEVVHRDVKPQNMLIVRATGELKIADFGLAQLSATDAGGHGLVTGTPSYMAPEQAQGLRTTFASDIYSLGVVLFEMFTGRCPFEGQTMEELGRQHVNALPPPPREIAPDLPEELEDVILHCLEKDPDRRPRSAADVSARLAMLSIQLANDLPDPPALPQPRGIGA